VESLTIVLFDPLTDIEVVPKSSPKASPPALEAAPKPLPEEPLPSQDEPLPQIARSRENQERKRSKSREKSRRRKRAEPGKTSRLASTLMSIGRALEERTGWGKRRKRAPVAPTVDEEVLSDIFSKFGIETKIDKIEAEFDAEAKAARADARSKIAAKPSPSPEEDLPSVFDVAYGTPSTRIQHHKFWTTAVSVLGIILVIQSVFLFRNQIARTLPGARPALVSLCNALGCSMPLPHDESQIEIVDYGFARLSERSDRYVLYVKVTNNAKFAQDWPNLELVLKNDIHQPLSRRILVPAEWVPPERFAQNTGIPPRGNVDINMQLEVTGITPSNFEVGHFYP
jgi:hypothetical protein